MSTALARDAALRACCLVVPVLRMVDSLLRSLAPARFRSARRTASIAVRRRRNPVMASNNSGSESWNQNASFASETSLSRYRAARPAAILACASVGLMYLSATTRAATLGSGLSRQI